MEKLPPLQRCTYRKDKQTKNYFCFVSRQKTLGTKLLIKSCIKASNFHNIATQRGIWSVKAFLHIDAKLPRRLEKDPVIILRDMCKEVVSQQSDEISDKIQL